MKELTKWRIFETISMFFCVAGTYFCSTVTVKIFSNMPVIYDYAAYALQVGLGCLVALWGVGFVIAAIFVIMLTYEVNGEIIMEMKQGRLAK